MERINNRDEYRVLSGFRGVEKIDCWTLPKDDQQICRAMKRRGLLRSVGISFDLALSPEGCSALIAYEEEQEAKRVAAAKEEKRTKEARWFSWKQLIVSNSVSFLLGIAAGIIANYIYAMLRP